MQIKRAIITPRALLMVDTFEGDLARASKVLERIVKLYNRISRFRGGEKFTQSQWDSAPAYILKDGQTLLTFLDAGLKRLETEIKGVIKKKPRKK